LAVGVAAAAVPAAVAAPLTVAYPTVFISQLIPDTDGEYKGSSGTTMRTAVQSRLASAGAGGVEIRSIGDGAAFTYNALGYRGADGYLYAMGLSGTAQDRLLRIE